MPRSRNQLRSQLNTRLRSRPKNPVSQLFLLLFLLPFSGYAETRPTPRFSAEIKPILAEHCLACHGPDAAQRKGDLRLDQADAAKASAIVPGSPENSPLIQRVTATDPSDRMPPPDTGRALSADQITSLKDWIEAGAPFEEHWSFSPIRSPKPPASKDPAQSEIDRFVLARLNAKGLSLAPEINRQQLIRRATFDLLGLPPSPEEVEAFVYDPSPDAYPNLIDRLLESPRYGEHWGRHWLDIARYADTHGGAAIGFRRFPFSYTYRDYVIRALNDDLPYDQFITQQIAADQLGLPPGHAGLAAVGFLTVGQQYRNPNDTIDDQIDVVTRGLLGLTVTCARCHDHKFDAIPTTDYYALYATFASSQPPTKLPTIGEPTDTAAFQDYQLKLQQRTMSYEETVREQSSVMRSRLRMQVGLYLRELAKGTPEQDLTVAFLSYRTDDLRPHVLEAWRQHLAKLTDDDPVFGPWRRLQHQGQNQGADEFAKACTDILQTLREENGDPSKHPAPQSLGGAPPRWNPRVLDAIETANPKNLLALADAYGALFGEIHQEWLQALLKSAVEARPGTKPIPDEDPQHAIINSAINRQLRRHLYGQDSPLTMSDEKAARLLNRPVSDNASGRRNAIHELHLNAPGSPPRAMTLEENPEDRPFHVFRRGNALDRGKIVHARFLTALTPNAPPPAFQPGKRRLSLAKALTNPANPLTRRVIANWVWLHHFGEGLVRTPDDFGTRGRPPTHPQLLDHLATLLLAEGWSLKSLHRQIMLSATYRQGAIERVQARNVDPENLLLWRMPRRRLSLEAMRDAMLAVSGELEYVTGGRPFNLLSDPVVPRRSIYAFVNRDIISPLASTFDAANPSSCTAQRPVTTVPQQTLFALNSDFIQDRAATLARLTEPEVGSDDEARVRQLYARCFGRLPRAEEVTLALEYIRSQDQSSITDAWAHLAHALLAANEFVFVD